MGLPKDLGIVGMKTNIALTIFFVPYIVFEIPSNILMKRFKPHVWRKSSHSPSTQGIVAMYCTDRDDSISMYTCVWNCHVMSRLWYVIGTLELCCGFFFLIDESPKLPRDPCNQIFPRFGGSWDISRKCVLIRGCINLYLT